MFIANYQTKVNINIGLQRAKYNNEHNSYQNYVLIMFVCIHE